MEGAGRITEFLASSTHDSNCQEHSPPRRYRCCGVAAPRTAHPTALITLNDADSDILLSKATRPSSLSIQRLPLALPRPRHPAVYTLSMSRPCLILALHPRYGSFAYNSLLSPNVFLKVCRVKCSPSFTTITVLLPRAFSSSSSSFPAPWSRRSDVPCFFN